MGEEQKKRKKKKDEEVEEDEGPTCPFWMLTFGDAMSLLLTFFVMLVSFTSFDEMKVGGFIGSVSLRFGGAGFSGRGSGLEKLERIVKILVRNRRALTFREQDQVISKLMNLKGYVKSQGIYDYIEITKVQRGYSIRIQNELLFEKGSDELSEQAKKVLKKILPLLKFVDNPLVIEGHTDDTPVKWGGKFRDNFELSFYRAKAVADFLRENGISDDRIGIAGLADLKPLYPNDTPEHRAKNRRVEIVIVGRTPDYSSI